MVSPEIMRLMSQSSESESENEGDKESGASPDQEDDAPAPGAAGLATPQPRKGDEAAARTKIHIAQNMLEQTLPAYDRDSDEGRAIMRVLSMLTDKFGNDNQQDLVPAQILQLVNGEPSLTGGPMKQAMQQQQGQPARPGAPPAGTLPGAPPNLGNGAMS